MKTFDFIKSPISHNLKDPHSKALEPDCLCPPLAIMTQSLEGVRGMLIFWVRNIEKQGHFSGEKKRVVL
jgi:hypothetical protein